MNNCHVCKEKPVDANNFKIVRACSTEYNTKIQEALLIKTCNPKLNSQLYANGSSLLLKVFLTYFFLKYLCYVAYEFLMQCDGCITCSMNFMYNYFVKIALMLRTV